MFNKFYTIRGSITKQQFHNNGINRDRNKNKERGRYFYMVKECESSICGSGEFRDIENKRECEIR